MKTQEKNNQTSKKELQPKKVKQETSIKRKLSKLQLSLLLIVPGLLITGIAGFWLLKSFWGPKDLAKILPQERLVILIEGSELELNEKLKAKHPELSTAWNQQLGLILGFDLSKTQQWRGDKLGFALLANEEQAAETPDLSAVIDENNIVSLAQNTSNDFVVFIETKSKKKAKAYLASLDANIQTANDLEIYQLPQRPVKCAFLEGYLACSNLSSTILTEIDQDQHKDNLLSDSSNYQKLLSQLPRNNSALIYLDIISAEQLLSQTWPQLKILTEDLQAIAISIKQNQYQIEISSLTLDNKANFEQLGNPLENSEEILSILPQKTAAFTHIKNSQQALNEALREITKIDPGFNDYTLGQIRLRLQELFSSEFSLEQDLFPLIEGDLVVGTSTSGDYFLLLSGSDPEFLEAKRQKLATGFEKMANDAVAQVLEQELEDGTVIEEVFPVYESLDKNSSTLLNGKLTSISMASESQSIGLTFAQVANYLIITTQEEIAKEIIEKLDLPKDRRQKSLLLDQYDLLTYSQASETFGFTSDWLETFWLAAPNDSEVRSGNSFLTSLSYILGKTNRFEDKTRVDLKLVF